MFGMKWRSLLLAGAVTLGGATLLTSPADAGWGYGYAYRPPIAPVRVYRPAYGYAPRYVAPIRRVYRPVVPVAPIAVLPYQAGYGYYPSYGVSPVGYFGY